VGDTPAPCALDPYTPHPVTLQLSKYNNLEKVESPGVQAEGLEKTFHL